MWNGPIHVWEWSMYGGAWSINVQVQKQITPECFMECFKKCFKKCSSPTDHSGMIRFIKLWEWPFPQITTGVTITRNGSFSRMVSRPAPFQRTPKEWFQGIPRERFQNIPRERFQIVLSVYPARHHTDMKRPWTPLSTPPTFQHPKGTSSKETVHKIPEGTIPYHSRGNDSRTMSNQNDVKPERCQGTYSVGEHSKMTPP